MTPAPTVQVPVRAYIDGRLRLSGWRTVHPPGVDHVFDPIDGRCSCGLLDLGR